MCVCVETEGESVCVCRAGGGGGRSEGEGPLLCTFFTKVLDDKKVKCPLYSAFVHY